MALLLVQVDVGNHSSANDMFVFVNQGLLQELFNVLDVLFINDLGEYPECVSLEDIVVRSLHVFQQATDNDKNFVFAHIQLLF